MRYLSSRPFVVGLLLVAGAFVAMPLFVTELTERTVTMPGPADWSWDTTHVMVFDIRIPMLMGVSGVTLMLLTLVRMRRANRRQ